MTLTKSLLLGSAATLVAVAGAQAADLPSKKAAPATYVKVCDAYGAGFFFIPGTDTCVKVGGYVRAEYTYSPAGNAVLPTTAPTVGNAVNPTGGSTSTYNKFYYWQPSQVSKNGEDTNGILARGVISLDARTATSVGTARTFIAVRTENKMGMYNNAALSGNFGASGQASSITLERALVQVAGFTFGRSTEIFSFMPAPNYISYGWSSFPSGVNQLAYTAVLGGGLSATVGLQDRSQMAQGTTPGSLFTAYTSASPNNYAGGVLGSAALSSANSSALISVANGPNVMPALAGNIRLDQAWGSAQVMGAVIQNNAVITGGTIYSGLTGATTPTMAIQSYNNTNGVTGGNSGKAINKTGWSVGAGLQLNLPQIGAGDKLWLTAAYSVGDLDHLNSSSTSDRSANIGREFTGLIRSDRNLWITPTAWAVTAGGAATLTSVRTDQTKGWSAGGIFTHYWAKDWRSNFIGSYLHIDVPTAVKATDWMFGGLSNANVTQVGHSIVWSPVANLDIGLETAYARLSQSLATYGQSGTTFSSANGYTAPAISAAPGTAASATATVTALPFKTSPNLFTVRLRADRTF